MSHGFYLVLAYALGLGLLASLLLVYWIKKRRWQKYWRQQQEIQRHA